MKYADLDKTTNNPLAFYDEEIHGFKQIKDPAFDITSGNTPTMIANPDCTIPASAVMISDVAWQAHINGVEQVYDAATKTWSAYVLTAQEKLITEKQSKKSAILAEYNKLMNADIVYQGATFQADEASEIAMLKKLTAVANGGLLPTGFAWTDLANNDIPADLPYLQGLYTAIQTRKDKQWQRLKTAKAAIRAAATTKAVNAVSL